MNRPRLKSVSSVPLKYVDDVRLLGITPRFDVYVEEIYSVLDWAAQHIVTPEGGLSASRDEDYGSNTHFEPFKRPVDLVKPGPVKRGHELNFSGARLRGLRETERITDTVRALSPAEKMTFAAYFNLTPPVPTLLGIAESSVTAEAEIIPGKWHVMCRRIRLAYALPEVRYDDMGYPFDYDTVTVYAAHDYDPALGSSADMLSFAELPAIFHGIRLRRPMDCLFYGGFLVVADGGGPDVPSQVHFWKLEDEFVPSAQAGQDNDDIHQP